MGQSVTNTEHCQILLMHQGQGAWPALAQGLASTGWGSIEAAEAIVALEAVRANAVDLVLLHLPVVQAIEMDLPEVLRGVSESLFLPIAIVADNPLQEQRCRLLDSGADEVLPTSLSADELVARLRALLRIKRLHDALAQSRAELEQSLHRERELLAKLRADNAHLQDLASTDPLTGLRNLRMFVPALEHEFKVAKRYDLPLSLLTLDVDHFKMVNDLYGHPSGDCVLRELADILRESVRESDVVARTGGEEFSILLPRADREHALRLAERIRAETFRRRFSFGGIAMHVTVSIGAATYPRDAEIVSPRVLVSCADKALLVAKDSGRDRVVPFHTLARPLRRRASVAVMCSQV
jgi:diguanylate cyclase (GGDEF)-like protein